MLLVIIADVHLGAKPQVSLIRREAATNDFEQGCLPGAILADDGHFFPSFHVEMQSGKKGMVLK